MPNRSAHLLLPRAKSSTALLLLLLPSLFVEAVSVNVTVDDTIPDPVTGATFTYAPTGRWNVGNNCTGCLAQPDPSLVYDGTWHDATYSRTEIGKDETQTAQISFNGYALYVYGIVSQSTISPNSTADISFYIDGELSGVFTYTPPGESSYLYNVCLYANDSLSAGSHSFMLQNGVAGGITSLVLFDYIIYTQDRDDPNPTPTSSSIAPVVTSATPSPTSVDSPSPNMLTATAGTMTTSTFTSPDPFITSSSNISTTGSSNTASTPEPTDESSAGSSSSPTDPSASAAMNSITGPTTNSITGPTANSITGSATATNAAGSTLGPPSSKSGAHTRTIAIASGVGAVGVISLILCLAYLCRRRKFNRLSSEKGGDSELVEPAAADDTRSPFAAESSQESPTPAMREQGGRLATRSTTISQSSTFAGPSNDPMDDDDIYGSDTPKSTYDPDTSEMLSSPYRRYGAPPAYHTLVGRE